MARSHRKYVVSPPARSHSPSKTGVNALMAARRSLPPGGERAKQKDLEAAPIDLSDSEIIQAAYAALHARKMLPAAEVEARQERYQALITRRDEARRRRFNNIFLFWVACEDGACKRNARCAGDPHACFQRWWPWVPERRKAYYRAYVHACAEDSTHEQAHQQAEAEVQRRADDIARLEAEQDARVRML